MSPGRAQRPLLLHPGFEQKTVHILVRWLLIILVFHFVDTSGVAPAEHGLAVNVSLAFIVSNLLLVAVPRRYFSPGGFVRWLTLADFAFVALALYFVREASSYYHWLFMLLFGLLAWRGRLREVLFGLGLGVVALGGLARFTAGRWLPFFDTADFLRASILFGVALFYFVVLELLNRNARLFHIIERAKQEWERTADAMNELILLVDHEGCIQRVNRALARQLGKTPRELVQQPWAVVLDASVTPRPDSPLARMFAGRAPVEARYTHNVLGCETQCVAVPLFEGEQVAGGIYILRP